ncbi:hypothetical protein O9559_23800, partial [Achromobacter xylosoxidans]|nr:hypothetical protein [Achromobacter xylosoxidans]
MRTRIKICGLTREEDIDAAVSAGVDAIGFVFYPKSKRYVTPTRAAQLRRAVPAAGGGGGGVGGLGAAGARAARLAAEGRSIVVLTSGEPDFDT